MFFDEGVIEYLTPIAAIWMSMTLFTFGTIDTKARSRL